MTQVPRQFPVNRGNDKKTLDQRLKLQVWELRKQIVIMSVVFVEPDHGPIN